MTNRALKRARGATPRRVELQQVRVRAKKRTCPRVIAYAGRISWWVTKGGQSFVFGSVRNRGRKGGKFAGALYLSISLSISLHWTRNQSLVRGEGEERKGGLPAAVGVSKPPRRAESVNPREDCEVGQLEGAATVTPPRENFLSLPSLDGEGNGSTGKGQPYRASWTLEFAYSISWVCREVRLLFP